jgi:uncharacterized protein (TIGR03085 family)
MSVAQQERASLVAAMREVGPDAPTLCGEWTTHDLAAHLVVRERRLDAAPGILISALADYTAKVQDKVAADNDWQSLLDKVASGPPLLSPFKLLDPLVNAGEMFIHHEDVRRAVALWEPRELDDATTASITRQIPMMARMTLSKASGHVSFRTPEGKTVATIGRGPTVVVTGAPAELLMFASGRDQHRATFSGDGAAVRAIREGRNGL